MWAYLIPISAGLTIFCGLWLIGIGWKWRRRSYGWLAWVGAMSVSYATVLLARDTAPAVLYVAAALSVAFMLATLLSIRREVFRLFGRELVLGGVALGAIAALELLAPPPNVAKVLIAALVLVMTVFAVSASVKLIRILRARGIG